jgi:hypothetical protein
MILLVVLLVVDPPPAPPVLLLLSGAFPCCFPFCGLLLAHYSSSFVADAVLFADPAAGLLMNNF